MSMIAILKKFLAFLNFLPSSRPDWRDAPLAGGKRQGGLDCQTPMDKTTLMSRSAIKTREPEEPPWWDMPERERPCFPEFEAVNNRAVFEKLHAQVGAGEFKMIEISDNITRIMEMLGNPRMRYSEVAEMIGKSPVLTGEFLKTVNSALYSHGQKITNLGVALSLLGLDNIKAMLYLYSSNFDLSYNDALNDVAAGIFEHSKSVALIAKYLSRRFYPKADIAFLAGMLHDIGKIAILKEVADDFDIPKLDFKLTEDAFGEIFPDLHCPVGKLLSKHWNIDENIALCIEHHHDYDAYDFPLEFRPAFHLCALIDLSDTIARMLGKGAFISGVDLFKHRACEYLDIRHSPETIEFLKPIPELLGKN